MFGVKANAVALLGKAPCQGDFIRWNAADPVSAQFHKWLEEGHEAVRRANLTLPAEPICFVYTAAGGRQALVGMMAPSSDKVGRQFPLCVYVPLELGPVSGNAATLHGSHQAFFAEARKFLADAAKLSADDLMKRLEGLGPHAAGDASAADTYRRRAVAAPASALVGQFTGDGAPPGAQYYAFRTFMMACAAERGKEPSKPGVTLDCPFPEVTGPYPWVEMARRMLQWRGMTPALFWHMGPSPRLLVSLGPPSSTLLLHLAKREHSSMKLWPLRTKATNAIETAKQALNSKQRQALDDASSTAESVILAFAS
ncbi:type VI secretion system-associated protein TagF [Hyalangium versicolor]|uniref:type VI secretion system-associated protein TagF n=1 Tax=Hyalangium versicolor TaxID=2861190 RepID=UPI001CCE5E2F|nr:type VI secretion system-associated protein TagF [Hyalangium versicolor]